MKILAIGAHPDDIEIFMYGFVSSCKKRGDKIFLATATDGAAGNIKLDNNLSAIRKKESLKALSKLGNPSFLNLPDGNLSYFEKSKTVIHDYIIDINPDLIVTHSPEDYHPDHRSLSKIVSDIAGFKCPLILADTLMGVGFVPEIYVDITDHFEDKLNAILAHDSQNPNKFIEATTILNRFRSAQCNGPKNTYAEAYRFDKRFPFSYINDLLPKSPKYRPYYKKKSDGLI